VNPLWSGRQINIAARILGPVATGLQPASAITPGLRRQCWPSVNDTPAFERLPFVAFAVMARIRMAVAGKSQAAERNRAFCRQFSARPEP